MKFLSIVLLPPSSLLPMLLPSRDSSRITLSAIQCDDANYTQVHDLINKHADRGGNKLLKSWSGFKGFAGRFDQKSIREIQSLDDVKFVEPEQKRLRWN
ncbi:hypothetical protein BC936DRAFT_136825 [Jimgerdemannia flammicorona]|uniref:Inhibitor I9 domain-containing protein n=1 Tax=Jimgerdemannia flammicorona TaxID=994334 RepID=A0A433DJJ1_9FUNG|nr:hypothetical protein BC936DRAFT_136825 [Jimgerdemannia flammicorona]